MTLSLARVAGLPAHLWTGAACPPLFARVRRTRQRGHDVRNRSVALAESIGARLVPDPGLSPADRARALVVRRRLHNGKAVESADLVGLAEMARRAGIERGLVRELTDLARDADELARTEKSLAAALAVERERSLGLAWDLVSADPTVGRAVRRANPAVFADIERRVANGEPWTTKRMRRRSDYLWRMIERGTTKPVPRAWFGHVGLVEVTDSATLAPPRPELTCGVVASVTDNIYASRRGLSAESTLWADPSVWIAFTPLRWVDDQRLRAWVDHRDVDEAIAEPDRIREVALRRTRAVDGLLVALGDRARPIPEAVDGLVPVAGSRPAALAFLRHLVAMGVLAVSSPPATRLVRGRYDTIDLTGQEADGAGRGGDRAYLDVYREPLTAGPAAGWCRRVERLLVESARIGSLIRADRPADPAPALTDRPRPVLDLVVERLRELAEPSGTPHRAAHRHGWARPNRPDSGYATLFDRLRDAGPGDQVDIGPTELDDLGAPVSEPNWPVEALVRPVGGVGGPLAVLGHSGPARVFDARFATVLADVTGATAGIHGYRELLRRIEDETGGLFVELLLPSVSTRASNAVRRPRYTRAWTGDPDPRPYYGEPPRPGDQYVPLSAITVCQRGDRVVAEADGRRIWPLHHATRAAEPPWDLVRDTLMRASPQADPWGACLIAANELMTDRDATPRITLGGDLVLTPATWRIEPADLWDPAAPVLAKALALDRLRERLGLPRWVMLGAPGGGLACDLDSVRAITVIERVGEESRRTGFRVEEMLPDPDRFATVDQRAPVPGRYATEFLMRAPAAISVAAMASRVTRTWRARDHADTADQRDSRPVEHTTEKLGRR